MSSTTEMISPQAARHAMAGDLKDQTETGDKGSGADAEMYTETDHVRGTGNRRGIGSDEKETGAEKEMMGMTGVTDKVRRENTTGCPRGVKKEKKGGEETTAVMKEVKVEERTSSCLKGNNNGLAFVAESGE